MSASSPSPPVWLERAESAVNGLPRWKKTLLSLAAVALVTGLAMEAAQKWLTRPTGESLPRVSSDVPGGDRRGAPPSIRHPEAPAPRVETGEQPAPNWAPALVHGGFGFFAAFCVGAALRFFARFTLFVAGAVVIILAAGAQLGVLEVHWDRLELGFRSLANAVRGQDFGFSASGIVPAGVLGSIGFLTGFKRS